ncbi:MAG: hypothetical protein IPL31_09990 [Saprospiraceae bacterium]|nr:hypothetical protein [Saprospiraceae bacterium]
MSSMFSATEPSLGYIYQIRYGLLLIVSSKDDDANLLIEQIDDISIDTSGNLDVYQTKYHLNSVANLTNSSPDLWKTIRVWSEQILSGAIDPEKTIFNLITTANATDTIPASLKYTTKVPRDLTVIQTDLLSIAKTSKSKTNAEGYNSFQNLTDAQQKHLIRNIVVSDSSIDINEAKTGILAELRYASTKTEALYERLEGWFLDQVIKQLLSQRNSITAKEVKERIIDISDTLKSDNLPSDFHQSIDQDESQLAPFRSQTFVKQLELIKLNDKLKNHAISDYYRAFSQKSKWLRDGLINALDEVKYDEQLREDWDKKFALISDEIPSLTPDAKSERGQTFYKKFYVETHPQVHIKERFKESYMVTGSCQMLADKKRVGWHPEFEKLIIDTDAS